jgi:DNA polymerase-1
MKKFLLIDSNSLIHRAYHALPPLKSPAGEPTGAVYGFISMLIRALKEINPDYVAAAFDVKAPTFRHEKYLEYKATRPPLPEDLGKQLERSKEVLSAMGILVLGIPGFEADDIIGTISEILKEKNDIEIIILSGDLDTLQLTRENLKILIPQKGISNIKVYDYKEIEQKYGFDPKNIPDYKALAGDPSDNIPGVKGIGEKTGKYLISKFGTIENLYENLENQQNIDISESIKKKLLSGKDMALLSRALASIRKDAPVPRNIEAYEFKKSLNPAVYKLFEQLGFKTLLPRIEEFYNNNRTIYAS